MQCIAFDSHKHYTWALVHDEKGEGARGRLAGTESVRFDLAEPQVSPRDRRARSDLRHVTRTTYRRLDSE